MKKEDVLNSYASPLVSPAYGKVPHKFIDREFFIISYETDPLAIKNALPEPLEPDGSNTVLYEWIKMPDAYGLGSYQESGLVIPCTFDGKKCNYSSQMYLDNVPAILAGREIFGFPKKYAKPNLFVAETETLTGTLEYNGIIVATGTMPYKYNESDPKEIEKALQKPPINLKLIPDIDCKPKIAQLITYEFAGLNIRAAWEGTARLHLVPHVHAPVADFPVRNILGAKYFIGDLALTNGNVLFDYLA